MDDVDDGYIKGFICKVKHPCHFCQESRSRCVVFRLEDVTLPEFVSEENTILRQRLVEGWAAVGIGCGCYAKLHRNIAHVQDSMKGR